MFRFFVVLFFVALAAVFGYGMYQTKVLNPSVARELRQEPNGLRAERVMLMTVDDRKTLPVNYLHEGNTVYVGADGPWWREMQGKGQPVALLIKGQVFSGRARAVTNKPEYTKDVFSRLRPDLPGWLPAVMSGVLVEIKLADGPDAGNG